MFKDLSLKNLLGILALSVASVLLVACEEKTASEKIEDAAEDIGDGMEDAADNFKN